MILVNRKWFDVSNRHWGHLEKWKNNPFFFVFIPYLNANKHSIRFYRFDQFDQFNFFQIISLFSFFNPSYSTLDWSLFLINCMIVLFFFISSVFSSICVIFFIFFTTDFWSIVFCFSKTFFLFVFPCLRVFMFSPSLFCRRCNPKCKNIEWVMLLPEKMKGLCAMLWCLT